VAEGFAYTSDGNKDWMDVASLRKWIDANGGKLGTI
jgi:hypothetical protein